MAQQSSVVDRLEESSEEVRSLTYAAAIREAIAQLLESDSRVFVIGQGVRSPWYVGASMADLDKDFGHERIFDTPVAENAVTGAAIGAALVGMRPIVVHPRMDFMLLAADPIINQAANWSYMFGGQVNVPIVIRAIINRGGQQAAQHSQALHAMFAHIPGLKVVMPSCPVDAKGLLIAAVNDGNPILYVDDRWLYSHVGRVPAEMYSTPIGTASVVRHGRDLTIVGTSCCTIDALRAAKDLAVENVQAEVIDLRTIKPWDVATVMASVEKTRNLVVVDGGWRSYGVSAEIAAAVSAEAFDVLERPVRRVTLPDAPAPMAKEAEQRYFISPEKVSNAVRSLLQSSVRQTRARRVSR